MHATADHTPWYRQGWPWFLIAVPATAVVGGLVTFYLAARGWDGPVAQDYYKQGLAVNAEIARASRAGELGVSARVSFKGLAIGDHVRVEVTAQQPLPPEAALRFRLIHPGRRDEDRTAMLSLTETAGDRRSAVFVGEWSGGPPSTVPGQAVAWQAVVETREWRLDDGFSAGGAGEFTLRTR